MIGPLIREILNGAIIVLNNILIGHFPFSVYRAFSLKIVSKYFYRSISLFAFEQFSFYRSISFFLVFLVYSTFTFIVHFPCSQKYHTFKQEIPDEPILEMITTKHNIGIIYLFWNLMPTFFCLKAQKKVLLEDERRPLSLSLNLTFFGSKVFFPTTQQFFFLEKLCNKLIAVLECEWNHD